MIYEERHVNLFTIDSKEYTFVHCISSDCKLGAGVALPMKKQFNLGGLKKLDLSLREHPTCIYYNGCYNMITKARYYNKPTYNTFTMSLMKLKEHALTNRIQKIAMPKIGCGLDGLSWGMVRNIIKEIFEPTDMEILVCTNKN